MSLNIYTGHLKQDEDTLRRVDIEPTDEHLEFFDYLFSIGAADTIYYASLSEAQMPEDLRKALRKMGFTDKDQIEISFA